jgi:MTH538 TIR-like domain (DUF1863)
MPRDWGPERHVRIGLVVLDRVCSPGSTEPFVAPTLEHIALGMTDVLYCRQLLTGKGVVVPTQTELRLSYAAESAARKSTDPMRRKCFLSYHAADADEVEKFITSYGEIFIARVIGITDEDDFIGSEDDEYVFDRIRDKYLADSTVTIVLVGKCTWARRYVDWEVYSSLRADRTNRLNGLLAITLPSAASYSGKKLPARVDDNVAADQEKGYARWKKYPKSSTSLREWIEDAFFSRSERAHLINNARSRKKLNSNCK